MNLHRSACPFEMHMTSSNLMFGCDHPKAPSLSLALQEGPGIILFE